MSKQGKILLILTGGTICSQADDSGHNFSNQAVAAPKLLDRYKNSTSPYRNVDFDVASPLDILSENMTTHAWNTLLAFLKTVPFQDYQGVLIAHGTDTLAYTASMVSFALAGISIPVVLVSSDYSLDDPRNNGTTNFMTGADLIQEGLAPGVYAVYRNGDGVTYLHHACQLRQCGDYSNDFFSRDLIPASEVICRQISWSQPSVKEGRKLPLYQTGTIRDCVLYLRPYTGINYARYDLTGLRAVVHGLFHARTACVEITSPDQSYGDSSVLSLLDRCHKSGIDFYIVPCQSEDYSYSSTSFLFDHGARGLYGMTPEASYVKVLLSYAMDFPSEEEREDFLRKDLCGEYCY